MSLEEFTMKRVRRQFTVGFKSNWNLALFGTGVRMIKNHHKLNHFLAF